MLKPVSDYIFYLIIVCSSLLCKNVMAQDSAITIETDKFACEVRDDAGRVLVMCQAVCQMLPQKGS